MRVEYSMQEERRMSRRVLIPADDAPELMLNEPYHVDAVPVLCNRRLKSAFWSV